MRELSFCRRETLWVDETQSYDNFAVY